MCTAKDIPFGLFPHTRGQRDPMEHPHTSRKTRFHPHRTTRHRGSCTASDRFVVALKPAHPWPESRAQLTITKHQNRIIRDSCAVCGRSRGSRCPQVCRARPKDFSCAVPMWTGGLGRIKFCTAPIPLLGIPGRSKRALQSASGREAGCPVAREVPGPISAHPRCCWG